MSLADTARKLDVNFYDYLRDRITVPMPFPIGRPDHPEG